MLQLTDGTVIVQDLTSTNLGGWWRLTPDNTGSYLNGTWSPIASLPKGYSPLYYASVALADGRVIIEGGEYNDDGSGQAAPGSSGPSLPIRARSTIQSPIHGPRICRPPFLTS
jgi:hypothetical protein